MGNLEQKAKGTSSILERLGEWRGPLTILLETSTAIGEVCLSVDRISKYVDCIQVHPIAKAVLATLNVVYRVGNLPSPPVQIQSEPSTPEAPRTRQVQRASSRSGREYGCHVSLYLRR